MLSIAYIQEQFDYDDMHVMKFVNKSHKILPVYIPILIISYQARGKEKR